MIDRPDSRGTMTIKQLIKITFEMSSNKNKMSSKHLAMRSTVVLNYQFHFESIASFLPADFGEMRFRLFTLQVKHSESFRSSLQASARENFSE